MELNDQVLVQDRLRNAVLAKVEKHQALSDDEIRVVCPVAFKETMSSKEIRNLGIFDNLSEQITIVEWPELLKLNNSQKKIDLYFEYNDDLDKRYLTFSSNYEIPFINEIK